MTNNDTTELININKLKLDHRLNNFDFLRFFAASLVIVSHSFAIFGLAEPGLSKFGSFGGVGVFTFFVMSGFLITKSWNETPYIILFLKKRILRLFPGLIITTLFCAFVIGPLVTRMTFYEYIENSQTWSYIKNIFLYPIQVNLPGVFLQNPIKIDVNGPLWTLPIEFFMYSLIGIIGLFKFKLINMKMLVPLTATGLIILDTLMLNSGNRNFIFLQMPFWVVIRLPIAFLMGSLFYLYSEKILLDLKIAFLVLTVFICFLNTPYANIIGYFTVPYLIIYFAFKGPSILRNFGKHGDFSYGMYIYAWPIQQTLVYFWAGRNNFIIYFILTFIIILFFAIISWYYIEKPALSLKNKKIISDII